MANNFKWKLFSIFIVLIYIVLKQLIMSANSE